MRTLALALLLLGLAAAGDDPAADYERRLAALAPGDVEGRYRLALWCEANGLAACALREHRAVVTLDPDHRASRRALGFEQVNGRWVAGREAMEAKGFVAFDGRWITPEEHAHLAKDEMAARAARQARKLADAALQRLKSANARERARAMEEILALDAPHRLRPLAIASRFAHADVRAAAVRGLGALDAKDALPPLYKRAIFDAEETIRQAAVEAIRATRAEGKLGPFVKALQSPFAPVRVHAAEALGMLGDPDAVGPLVARFEVAGGSGQSVYISQVDQISYVQDFDVEVAQTAFIADPVIGVLQDGLTLNFRVLSTHGTVDVYERAAYAGALARLTGKQLGDDPKAWSEWYRAQRRLEREAARAQAE
jgi:hypothetical protein